MTICSYQNTIQEGSHVLIYTTPARSYPIQVDCTQRFALADGYLNHSEMIGLRFGVKMWSHNKRSFVYLLHQTCETWSLSLPHRTQIVYTPDIAFIQAMLGVRPGSRVLESGTGSASFTHALARGVTVNGAVFTYEYHEERVKTACQELQDHGILPSIVTITHRDVCVDGFKLEDDSLPTDIDKIFLDLPEPWKAIAHTLPCLTTKRPARICCFSPCIEQVQNTAHALAVNGFSEVEMYECLQRPYHQRTIQLPSIQTVMEKSDKKLRSGRQSTTWEVDSATKGHTAFLTFATRVLDVDE